MNEDILNQVNFDRDPLIQFEKWFQIIMEHKEIIEPNAMALATISSDQHPSLRIVLLKNYDARGLVFFTNFNSRKAKEIMENPSVALLFWWAPLHWQVRIEGYAEKISDVEADIYFQSRPRGSQIGAIISPQSEVIQDRRHLEHLFEEMVHDYAEKAIPRPSYWGGFRVKPNLYEFWKRGEHRLHDRIRYRLDQKDWLIERLAP